ncbi:unnamed protein product [Ambrosiozyma monospora]|uniref:Unnamed protein product n=1 Tax=Ambrosiozyma monospora TaxID=43982 RepID=A0A9W7DK27_AMBMO|nr:unnamed protein product [Ambrosiozyma monospora]
MVFYPPLVNWQIANQKGDLCILPAILNHCGSCHLCETKVQYACPKSDYPGTFMDGMLAEFIRVPHADESLLLAPKNVSLESLVMLSDALPTSYEIGVEGKVQKGDRVAVFGCGPVGLSAILTATIAKPSVLIAIDINEHRLQVAKRLGATHLLNPTQPDFVQQVLKLTCAPEFSDRKPGVDVAIDCAGKAGTVTAAQQLVTVGGKVAVVACGIPETPVNFFEMQKKSMALSSGFMSGHSVALLTEMVARGELDPSPLVSHKFKLHEIEKAYDVFSHAIENNTIKVLLVNED